MIILYYIYIIYIYICRWHRPPNCWQFNRDIDDLPMQVLDNASHGYRSSPLVPQNRTVSLRENKDYRRFNICKSQGHHDWAQIAPPEPHFPVLGTNWTWWNHLRQLGMVQTWVHDNYTYHWKARLRTKYICIYNYHQAIRYRMLQTALPLQ